MNYLHGQVNFHILICPIMCQGMNNNWQMMYPEQDLSLIVVVQFKLQMGEDTKALNYLHAQSNIKRSKQEVLFLVDRCVD